MQHSQDVSFPAMMRSPKESKLPLILHMMTVGLLAGIFVALVVLIVVVAPGFNAVAPVLGSVDPTVMKGAGRLIVSADRFFNEFSIEDLQLIPSNIPSLILSVLQMDLAPLARNVTTATSSMVSALAEMKPSDGSGRTYATVATYLSAADGLAKTLQQWAPVSVNGAGASCDSDPWHGLPSMIFGKSPVDWLYNQTDPVRLAALGDACAKFETQLEASAALSFSFHKYLYNYSKGTITMGDLVTPLDGHVSDIKTTMSNICTALQNAANVSEPQARQPALGKQKVV